MFADRLAVEPTNCLCYAPLSLYDEKWISCKRVGKDVNRKPEHMYTYTHTQEGKHYDFNIKMKTF